MSSPAGRMLAPRGTAALMATTPSPASQSSCMTTVSTPAGIGAPVKMRTACPASTTPSKTVPAGTRPTTGSVSPGATPPPGARRP